MRPQFHLHTSAVIVGFLCLLLGLFRASPALGLVWLVCLVPAARFTAGAAERRRVRGERPGPLGLAGATVASSLALVLVAAAIALVPAWLFCFFSNQLRDKRADVKWRAFAISLTEIGGIPAETGENPEQETQSRPQVRQAQASPEGSRPSTRACA